MINNFNIVAKILFTKVKVSLAKDLQEVVVHQIFNEIDRLSG